jgi:alpha-1,6-mannosyltransferase
MYYNAIQGQASKWGVEPWDYYFSNSLPKLLMSSVLLIPAGVAWQWLGRLGITVLPVEMMYHLREVGDEWVWGALGMLGAMSCLGHKVGISRGLAARRTFLCAGCE